jgi:hypothetical protein
MRTTIDLPEDLHRIAISIARDRSQTLSETVAAIMRRGLANSSGGPDDDEGLHRSPVTGLLVMQGNGTPITIDDVRSLDDEQ